MFFALQQTSVVINLSLVPNTNICCHLFYLFVFFTFFSHKERGLSFFVMERITQGQKKLCSLDQKVRVVRSLQVSPEYQRFPLEEDQSCLQGTRTPFLQMLQDPCSVHSPIHSETNPYYYYNQNPLLEGINEDISSQECQLNSSLNNAHLRRKHRNNNLAATSVSREKRRRRRTKPTKNRQEMESQRMTHIAVERNRRRQMNVHLNSLRSLIPPSYLLRGDQASIVGGAIGFVKILEQHLQSLEAQKITQQTSKLRIDATVIIERHVNIKIQCLQRKQGQLVRSIILLEKLGLTVLHLNMNITSPCNASVSYCFSLKMEEDCNLGSVDEITEAFRQIFSTVD